MGTASRFRPKNPDLPHRYRRVPIVDSSSVGYSWKLSICCVLLLTERSPHQPLCFGHQPCLCLCLGFSQMILTLPFLLMTLHLSQIGFTEDLTFISVTSLRVFQHTVRKQTAIYFNTKGAKIQQISYLQYVVFYLFISPNDASF